jgi:Eukaryotic aspartyl protease
MSSSGSTLWVPFPEGCIATDSTDCPEQRGGLFKYNDSSTWVPNHSKKLPLQAEASLGYSGSSLVGFDNVTLDSIGSGGVSLNKTVVTGIATKDFFLGQLGLYPRRVDIPDLKQVYSSPLLSLFEAQEIPSLSWSYTAGAPYREIRSYGSLTLGGYDAARFEHGHNLTTSLSADVSRDLQVAITGVSSGGRSLLSSGIYAFIDSTVPHIWLPRDACAKFEEVFGLEYDSATNLYLVNDTLREQLLRSQPNITISLAASLSTNAGERPYGMNITLPYSAFDLVAWYPVASSTDIGATARYFPLRRADNESQYTLGRAFLQEAYLHVDYGRSNFTIWQMKISSDPANVIPVYPDGHSTTNSSDPKPQKNFNPPNKRLSSGGIAGIAIAVILSAAIFIVALKFYRIRQYQRGLAKAPQSPVDGQDVTAYSDSKEPKAELAGSPSSRHKFSYRSRIFLDGKEVSQPVGSEGPEKSPKSTTTISEPESGSKITASELDSVGDTYRAELDAVGNQISELPAAVGRERMND